MVKPIESSCLISIALENNNLATWYMLCTVTQTIDSINQPCNLQVWQPPVANLLGLWHQGGCNSNMYLYLAFCFNDSLYECKSLRNDIQVWCIVFQSDVYVPSYLHVFGMIHRGRVMKIGMYEQIHFISCPIFSQLVLSVWTNDS